MSLLDELIKHKDCLLDDKIIADTIIYYMSDKTEYRFNENFDMHFVNMLYIFDNNDRNPARQISGYITNYKYIIGYSIWLEDDRKNDWDYGMSVCLYFKYIIDDLERLSTYDFCIHCNYVIEMESISHYECDKPNITFGLLLPSMTKSAIK